jgi:uncharacterized membrane protein YqjE
MEPSTEDAPGLWLSLQRLGRTALGIAQNRVELLLVELEEERWRVVDALLLAASATVLALMTFIAGTIALVLFFPAEQRPVVLALVTGLYLLSTLAVLLKLRNRLKNWRSFSATLAELKKDKACLDEKP